MKPFGHGLVLGKFYPRTPATTTSSAPPRTAASG